MNAGAVFLKFKIERKDFKSIWDCTTVEASPPRVRSYNDAIEFIKIVPAYVC